VDGALTAGLSCGSCGTELPPNSKFCNECGAPLTHAARSAEYKQVTVLFADVVHSMDIAATVGTERLREIMAELVDRAAVVVQHFGGTVGSFTGDGIMAVFGAPVALEDHAVRACLAALGVQEEATRLASDLQERDGVELQLRVGLNSGQVITIVLRGALKLPGLQDNLPMLLGRAMHENSNMDGTFNAAATANDYLLLYGDFGQNVIVDRLGSTVEIVPHLVGLNRRPTGQRGALLWFHTGSNVVVSQAFLLLNIATAA
jgi:hypothetical protein